MDGSTTKAAAAQELAEHCMQIESMYAALKFRAYGMAKDRQVLEFHVAGLRPDNEGMRGRIAQFREEVAGLKAEVERLREENRQLKEATTCCVQVDGQDRAAQKHEEEHQGWIRGLLRRLRAHRG